MSNTIQTDGEGPPKRFSIACLAPLLLLAQGACSASDPAAASNREEPEALPTASVPAPTADASDLHPTGAPAPAPLSDAKQTASRIIGKRDRTIAGGKRVCDVDFVYAGREPEDVFWDEPCAAVTAKLVKQDELEASGRWTRLDTFQQKFVGQMPGGQVLYIEGSFSASVYPIDETGTSIEVAVAD